MIPCPRGTIPAETMDAFPAGPERERQGLRGSGGLAQILTIGLQRRDFCVRSGLAFGDDGRELLRDTCQIGRQIGTVDISALQLVQLRPSFGKAAVEAVGDDHHRVPLGGLPDEELVDRTDEPARSGSFAVSSCPATFSMPVI